MLPVAAETLLDIADRHGTPAYVYDLRHVRRRVAELREAFGDALRISYAVKANPHPVILAAMRGLVNALDVSSVGEIEKALAAGWPADRLGFTGPGKRDHELRRAVDVALGDVIVESLDEIGRLAHAAAATGRRQSVLLRVCPDTVVPGFGSRMAGKPTQFGIEENLIDEAVELVRRAPSLELSGLHLYAGTQCLNADTIIAHFDATLSLFESICDRIDCCPRRLIIGSGFGIPYHANDRPLDLARLGPPIRDRLAKLGALTRFHHTNVFLETGRFLIGEAGVYLTRVITTKTSRGFPVAVCDGGMHHHLAAAGHLGSVLHRNYPIYKVSPPSLPADQWIPQLIFGPLCTSIDLLGNQVRLPPLANGDVLAIGCSGAYGLTSSPQAFISHAPPSELVLNADSASTADPLWPT